MKKITMIVMALMIGTFALAIQAASAAEEVKPAAAADTKASGTATGPKDAVDCAKIVDAARACPAGNCSKQQAAAAEEEAKKAAAGKK